RAGFEEETAKVGVNAQALPAGSNGQQVEFPSEVEVRQQAVAGLEILQSGGDSGLAKLAVGGKAKNMRGLFAQDYDVFEMIIVQVADQAAAVGSARSGGQSVA